MVNLLWTIILFVIWGCQKARKWKLKDHSCRWIRSDNMWRGIQTTPNLPQKERIGSKIERGNSEAESYKKKNKSFRWWWGNNHKRKRHIIIKGSPESKENFSTIESNDETVNYDSSMEIIFFDQDKVKCLGYNQRMTWHWEIGLWFNFSARCMQHFVWSIIHFEDHDSFKSTWERLLQRTGINPSHFQLIKLLLRLRKEIFPKYFLRLTKEDVT